MRLFFPLIILLCFPVLEIYAMFKVADLIGWWLLLWLIASAFAGWTLIREEQLAFFGRVISAAHSGQSPVTAFFDSGRTLLAGLLLIFPGVISDAIAVILLLLPRPRRPVFQTPAEDGVIEGEYRREFDADRLS